MSNLPFQTSGWDTHLEVQLAEIDWPLFAMCPTHFTLLRTYEGPKATYKAKQLDMLDAGFNGATYSGTGEADDDIVTLSGSPPLFTGCPVVIADVAGMTGIGNGTYYAIVVAANQIKLAVSVQNAEAGTNDAISADGTCTVTIPAAYLVGQSRLADVGGGVVRYSRQFSTLPPQWFDPQGYSYTFPGLTAGTVGSTASVVTIAAGSLNEVILGTSLTGVTTSDTISAQVQYTRAGVVYSQAFYGNPVAVSSGASITMSGNLLGSVGSPSSVSGAISEVVVGRTVPRNFTVDGRVQHDYALTSMASISTDLPVFEPFNPITATGTETDALTSTTSPTNTQYGALVTSGGEIVVECTRERYLGNIFVRKTTYVPAK